MLFLVTTFLGAVWCSRMNDMTSRESKKYVLKSWQPSLKQQAVMTSLAMIAVVVIGIPNVYGVLGPKTVDVMRNLRAYDRLSRRDLVAMERGYYEKLSTVNQFNTELWKRYVQRTPDWKNMVETDAMRETRDFEWNQLVPNTKLVLKREPLEINRWGMRDNDYERVKPSGTLRIVLLGASHTFGSGVANDETFENVVEGRLNQLEGQPCERYEILNLSVPGYDLLRSAHYLGTYAIEFQPDIVISVSLVQDGRRAVQHLARVVACEYPVPYPKLEDIVRRAKVSSDMGQNRIERRLLPFQDELLAWAYGHIAEICHGRGIPGIWILLQPVSGAVAQEEVDRVFELASAAGLTTWDFMHVYDGHREVDLRLSAWDVHPNAKAHELVADHLFGKLAEEGIIQVRSLEAL